MTNTSDDKKDIEKIRDDIIEAALIDVPFDGWRWRIIQAASERAGYKKDMAICAFPEELDDALSHFADWVDRQMLAKLESINPEDLKIRSRIRAGVLARFDVLSPHKEAVRYALAYWSLPGRQIQGSKILWRAANRIWNWAGDEATDYNHYTKRGLLCSVMASTALVWLDDDEFDAKGNCKTTRFLDARISNVLSIGKTVGQRLGPYIGPLFDQLPFSKFNNTST